MDSPSARPPAVELRGLRRSFGGGLLRKPREVLHGIDLKIAAGEFVGLVGPNGSGKSTLLRVLAAVDEPTSGEARVFGLAPGERRARAWTGYCPEDSPFPPELRAREALELLGSLYDLRGAELARRADQLLERVGLSGVARKPLSSFSRGMLRRFGLAQALLHEPRLILLDEPTAGLDAPGFAAAEVLLDEARSRGATLLVSSHLFGDLHQRCDRIVVLVDGTLVAQGSATELVRSLGAGARLELVVEGLDEAGLDALRREAQRHGGSILGVQPAQSNLTALYRREHADPAP